MKAIVQQPHPLPHLQLRPLFPPPSPPLHIFLVNGTTLKYISGRIPVSTCVFRHWDMKCSRVLISGDCRRGSVKKLLTPESPLITNNNRQPPAPTLCSPPPKKILCTPMYSIIVYLYSTLQGLGRHHSQKRSANQVA